MTSKIIVALISRKEAEALALVDQIDPSLCRLKVGKEMFTTLGINFVKQLHQRNFDVFFGSEISRYSKYGSKSSSFCC